MINILKKWWFWLIVFFGILTIYGAVVGINRAQEEMESETVATEVDPEEEVEEVEEPTEEVELTIEETIQNEVDRIVNEDFRSTEINDLKVNLHAGRDDGSYIVLPHLKWDVRNRVGTTRDMLEQYSDHLAATLADIDEISEITVFWEVPYHKEDTNIAKYEYAREGEGMAIGDVWHDVVIKD